MVQIGGKFMPEWTIVHPAPDGDYLFVKENDQVSSPCGDRFDRQF